MKTKSIIMCLALVLLAAPAFAEVPGSDEPYSLVITPSLTGSLILPIGVFTDLTDLGGGAEIGVQVRNVFFKNAVLRLLFGYNFVAEHIQSVDSFGVSSLALFAGYAIPLSDAFSITPLVGGGYVGHVVSATDTALYFDPELRLQVDFSLSFSPSFSIYAAPYFTFFFEQSNLGLYAGLNLGAALSFTVPLGAGSGSVPGPGPAPVPLLPGDVFLSRDLPAFSPNNDGIKDVIVFQPKAGGAFNQFEIAIVDGEKRTVKSMRGGSTLPREWVWNGAKDDGNVAADGTYTAVLTLTGSSGKATASSEPFDLDTVGVAAALSVSPKRFSPDGDGAADTASIALTLTDPGDLNDWSLKILDPAGNLFLERRSLDPKTAAFAWNGTSAAGELVQSASEYPVEATAYDRAGNAVVLKGTVSTDILIQRFGSRVKVVIPSIIFEGFNADFRQGKPEQVAKNLEILDRLGQIFRKYAGYNLIVEGYAVNIYDDPVRMERENREALLPLSKKRAESIRLALIERGFAAARIKAVGKGNANPVVPYKDKANQWKNRRVEFILEK
ncbi:MAG: OmpA family protein [Spirochaetales bacterium]|nr:OmpA family protein [Spirochaetales bacterium]